MTAREAVCWLLAVGAVLAPFLGSAPTAGSSPARARSARPGTRACRRTRPCSCPPAFPPGRPVQEPADPQRARLNEVNRRHTGEALAAVIEDRAAAIALLAELAEWAVDACQQGAGGDPFNGPPGWDACLSTWEEADELLPRVAEFLEGGRA